MLQLADMITTRRAETGSSHIGSRNLLRPLSEVPVVGLFLFKWRTQGTAGVTRT